MTDNSASLEIAAGHHQAGRFAEAERLYRQILAADPTCVTAWNLLGALAIDLKRDEVAIQCLQRALTFQPGSVEANYHMGLALHGQGKFDEAIASYRRALEYGPNHAKAHNNLAAALKEQGRLAEALPYVRKSLELDPNSADAHCNLGNVLQAQGNWDEALHGFEQAIALRPEYPAAHTNRAMILLSSGDFDRGWPEYEWRWKTGQIVERRFGQPQWDGGPLDGQTILLHAEQGLGDTLQFIRYAPLVKASGAVVIVECHKALTRLLASCPGFDRLIASGDALPPFDVHAPLLSLPGIFKTTVSTIPAPVPYVFADSDLVEHWRERLAAVRGFRIGINWRGRSGQGLFRLRDIPLSHFASLAGLSISLVILQQGATEQVLAEVTGGLPIFHPGDDFDRSNGAFMDTAAIMKNLDLVITSDTSVPHVAGALGVPVWIALPNVAGWQWLRDRADSPWYPTARLFRQEAPGDWNGVFNEIRRALAGAIG